MKILFQGDSITDVGRNNHSGSLIPIGQGYACLIASRLGADEPGKYDFVNLGISGNRIVDVYARIKCPRAIPRPRSNTARISSIRESPRSRACLRPSEKMTSAPRSRL